MFDIALMMAQSIDLSALGNLLIENGVFAVLFGWLLFDTRREAKAREERLMSHIEKQEDALGKVTDTIERMDTRLSNIEDKVRDK